MVLFLSKYINSVDKKGRVSIPASYRSSLANDSKVVIYPSLKNNCIEACSIEKLLKVINIIDNLDPFSEERDCFQTAILSESINLSVDNEGRITVPKAMLMNAKITNKIAFIGKGSVFEMWNPEFFEEYLIKCKNIASKNLKMLKW